MVKYSIFYSGKGKEKPQKHEVADSSRRINMHRAAIHPRAKESSKGTW